MEKSSTLWKYKFEVLGEVVGKERPRFARGHTYTPKKTKDYETAIKNSFRCKCSYLSKKALRIKILAYFSVPNSTPKSKKEKMLLNQVSCTKKPDFDNIAKIVCDALNNVAYHDDAQIAESIVMKRWGGQDKLVVMLEEIGEPYKKIGGQKNGRKS